MSDVQASSPVYGVLLFFDGLGCCHPRSGLRPVERLLVDDGVLVVQPYIGPWSWMNRTERQFVDQLIDGLLQDPALPAATPILATGLSMGTLAALLFTRYTRHRVAGVSTLYPVCDSPFHAHERPDVLRTLLAAFRGESDTFDNLLQEHSPLTQVPGMPAIPYWLCHGDNDQLVSKAMHFDCFAQSMTAAGHDVTYHALPELAHGDPEPPHLLIDRADHLRRCLERIRR